MKEEPDGKILKYYPELFYSLPTLSITKPQDTEPRPEYVGPRPRNNCNMSSLCLITCLTLTGRPETCNVKDSLPVCPTRF